MAESTSIAPQPIVSSSHQDFVEYVLSDLQVTQQWDKAAIRVSATGAGWPSHVQIHQHGHLPLSQVPLPQLHTCGLMGGPFGHTQRLVVPVSTERQLPPDALFGLLSGLPDGAPRPLLAIVDSCTSVVYVKLDAQLPERHM